MHKINNILGYSLIEVFIAMVVLSIVLLGMAGLIKITVSINRSSAEKTVAITLAQDKMEEMIKNGFLNVSATNQTVTEAYGDMVNYLSYRRVTDIKIDKPDTDLKLITIDIYWNNDNRRVRLQSIVSNTDPVWP